jgi:O-antigen/teichoic acid export membrane protein
MQKNYIRNIIFSVSSLLLLVLAYILVPKYHIKGVAIAQLLQSVFALFTCLILVIVYTKYNPLKWNWSKQIFKQIFSYGMKFQFISLANMLNEPITKILLGKFGGMAFAGYYEMANRLLMQARGVIISSTQSLVPVMINLSKNEIPAFYKKTFSNVLFFSMTIMACIVLSGRIVSFYWIGSYQPVFCTALLILSLSLFVNILNAPAYFYYMADGNLNILIKNHLLLGLLNALLSYLLGYWFGGFGVVFGWFIAILFSSLYLLLTFNKMYNLKLRGLFQYMDVISISFMFVLILISKFFKPSVDFRLFDGIFLLLTILYFTFIFLKFKIANYIQVQNKE